MNDDDDTKEILAAIFDYMQDVKKSGVVEQILNDSSCRSAPDQSAAEHAGIGKKPGLDENPSAKDALPERKDVPEE